MRSGRGEGKEGEGKGREGREEEWGEGRRGEESERGGEERSKRGEERERGGEGEGRREFLATNDIQQFSNRNVSLLLTLRPKEEKNARVIKEIRFILR